MLEDMMKLNICDYFILVQNMREFFRELDIIFS